MAVINKTAGTSILDLQSNAGNNVLIGNTIDVSTKLAAKIALFFGRRSATAGGAGVNIRVEAAFNDAATIWRNIYTYTTTFAACESEAVSGTVNAGTNVVTVASTTNLTVGDYVFINNTTIGNSEWGRIKAISANTSITLEENLLNAQTGSTIYDLAEDFICDIDLIAVKKLRIVVDGSSFTQAHAVMALMITGDSIS